MTIEEYNRKAEELNKQMRCAKSPMRINDLKRAMARLERKYVRFNRQKNHQRNTNNN